MNNVYIIYDDSVKVNYNISSVIGEKTFGEVVYKRLTFQDRFFRLIQKFPFAKSFYVLKDQEAIFHLMERINELPEDSLFLHIFSNTVIVNEDKFSTLLKKISYAKESICIYCADSPVAYVSVGVKDYQQFLKLALGNKDTMKVFSELERDVLETDSLSDMNNLSQFLQYITGGFDARFFNALSGDEYTVTKSSASITKIKSEYTYYHLLPEDMQRWFVLPYNYQENSESASYTMERLHMADIAIRWVHGAFDKDEFFVLMKRVFYFINSRKTRILDKQSYIKMSRKLYIDKVQQRIEELKSHKLYPIIKTYIEKGTEFVSLDDIYSYYEKLFRDVEAEVNRHPIAVIGHGDLCFSNMLYNKETETLKFIDVKGALKEEDLWTNPYYDIAKLSHSVCGRYDFFNNNMYEIRMNQQMELELEIDFDNTEYIEIFKEYLQENKINYRMIRVLEASLFLSMLPLHMDNPRKVYGFLLNAINIMKEVEKC